MLCISHLSLQWYCILTPWRLGGFGNFRKKNSSFRLPYQHPSSSADCARELFNGSNGLASLVDCTRKKNWGITHKKPAPPRQKIFLECNLLDWPIRLSRCTVL